MRKERQLALSDRINATVHADADLTAALTPYRDQIAKEILATELAITTAEHANDATAADIDGRSVFVSW